jgi:hypothetical protein
MMLMVGAAIGLSIYFGQTKGGIFNTMADYNAYLVPGVIVAYVAGILRPGVTSTGALACILAGPLLSIVFERGAHFGFDHSLQAFHRAGLATVGCVLVVTIVSMLTQSERDNARELYTWGRFRNQPGDDQAIARPWWQRDKLWATILVLATLGMCWFFA